MIVVMREGDVRLFGYRGRSQLYLMWRLWCLVVCGKVWLLRLQIDVVKIWKLLPFCGEAAVTAALDNNCPMTSPSPN